MAIKAINDIIGLNGLIPILLVFGVYSRIIQNFSFSLNIYIKGNIMWKTIKIFWEKCIKIDFNCAF